MTKDNFGVGDMVRKTNGYGFPGMIIADFKTTRGERRLVVECMAADVEGVLHIFRPSQLKKDEVSFGNR